MRRHRLGESLIPIIEGVENTDDYKKFCEAKQYLQSATKCSFVNDECPRQRAYGESQCCVHCADQSGYLDDDFFPKEKKHYFKLFDKKKGFLGDDGCLLPVKLRSLTCVGYCCSYQREELKYRYGSKIDSVSRKRDRQREIAFTLRRKLLASAGF